MICCSCSSFLFFDIHIPLVLLPLIPSHVHLPRRVCIVPYYEICTTYTIIIAILWQQPLSAKSMDIKLPFQSITSRIRSLYDFWPNSGPPTAPGGWRIFFHRTVDEPTAITTALHFLHYSPLTLYPPAAVAPSLLCLRLNDFLYLKYFLFFFSRDINCVTVFIPEFSVDINPQPRPRTPHHSFPEFMTKHSRSTMTT